MPVNRVVYAVGWAYGSPGQSAPVALVSRDAGRSWSPIATLPPGCSELRGVTAQPARSDSVFFGGSETAADGQGRGTLWPTQDGGATWKAVQHAQGGFFCVLIDPHDPNVVYACAGQVFKSTDGGATWQGKCAPYAGPVCGLETRPAALTVSYRDGVQVLYAGVTGVWVHEKAHDELGVGLPAPSIPSPPRRQGTKTQSERVSFFASFVSSCPCAFVLFRNRA